MISHQIPRESRAISREIRNIFRTISCAIGENFPRKSRMSGMFVNSFCLRVL